MSAVRDVVEVVARALVDQPQAVKVTESEQRGLTLVALTVAPNDVGKMVGRQGRTAAALRTLLAATAEQHGHDAKLEILDAPPRA